MKLDFRHKTYHRNLLETLLKKNSDFIQGKILDIGSGNRRYDHWFKGAVTAVDLRPNPALKVEFGDMEKGLNFPDQSFDGILCLEVFEYLENPLKAIGEIYRLLKLAGQAIITIPFMYHEHQDKIRFTEGFLAKQFDQFSVCQIKHVGNAYTIIWDILRKKWLLNKKGWRVTLIWYLVLYPLLFLVKPHEKMGDKYYSGLFIILKK